MPAKRLALFSAVVPKETIEEEASLDLYLKRIEAEIAEAEKDIDWLNNGPDTRLRRQGTKIT
jgi:hypothetical protein